MLCVTPIVALPVSVVPLVGVISDEPAAELTSAPAFPIPVPWRLSVPERFVPAIGIEAPLVTVTGAKSSIWSLPVPPS